MVVRQPHSYFVAAALAAALVALALAAPVWYWNGGLLDEEGLVFLRNYLADRPFLQLVFDPHRNDFDTYQARELSFVFGAIDAKVFDRLMRSNVLLFVPFSGMLAALLTAAAYLAGARRLTPAVPVVTVLMLLLVYFSNYVHLVTAGMYYRPTKPLLTPALTAAAFVVATLLRDEGRPGVTRWVGPAAVFALFCIMSWLDRMGFGYALIGFGALVLHAVITRRRWDLVAAAGAAVAAMVAWNQVAGPWVAHAVNGYWPDAQYQQVPVARLLTNPARVLQAIELLGIAAGVILGSVSWWLALGVTAALGAAVVARSRHRLTTALVLCAVAAAQVALLAVMIVRHPPVYEYSDHRVWYYPQPLQALLLVLFLAGVNALVRYLRGWRVIVLNAALAVLVVVNMTRWDEHRWAMEDSTWFPGVQRQTELLKTSFRERAPADGLDGRFWRPFYDFALERWPGLRARAPWGAGLEPPYQR